MIRVNTIDQINDLLEEFGYEVLEHKILSVGGRWYDEITADLEAGKPDENDELCHAGYHVHVTISHSMDEPRNHIVQLYSMQTGDMLSEHIEVGNDFFMPEMRALLKRKDLPF